MQTVFANWRRSFSSLILAACVVSLLSGCGRENKIYADPTTPVDGDELRIIDGRRSLPAGFFDHSVNQASAEMSLDGTTATSLAIRLVTWPQTNGRHAFNGDGEGNRALLGLAPYSGRKLSEIGQISFEAKNIGSPQNVELLLVTDLNCDGGDVRVLIADADALNLDRQDAGNGYWRYSAGISDVKWKALDDPILDPAHPTAELVPQADVFGTDVDLNALLTAYPNACVRNSVTIESGMPHGLPVSGILFSLGNETHTDYAGAFIRRVEVGSDIYDASDWSSP